MGPSGRAGRSSLRLWRIVPWPLLVAALVVVILGSSAVHSLSQSTALVEQRWQSTQAVLGAERLLSTMKDAETGQRGYIITGRPAYLEPYLQAGERLGAALGELEAAVGDDPEQVRSARRLRVLITDKLEDLARTIDLRREGRMDDVLALVGSDRGRLLMGHIRDETQRLTTRALAGAEGRNADYVRSVRRSFLVVIVGSAVLFVLTAFATMTTARELRARGRAERAARKLLGDSEQARGLLDAIFEAAPVGLVLFDRRLRISRSNAAMAALAGRPAESHAGQALVDVLPGLDPAAIELMALVRDQGVATERELRVHSTDPRAPGDEERVLLMRCALAAELGVIALFIDITERKRAEAERERLVRALARSNQDLNEFAYVASHDLKAPLRGITHLSEWLEEDLGPNLPGPAREKLGLLQGRARRLENLIDGILNYSRAGRARTAATQVDVRAMLKEVIDLLGKPAALAVEVQDGVWPELLTEKAALEQVFMNLVSNALKHAQRPGLRIVVGATPGPTGWIFSVADNGPGIAREYHDRVWGIFQTLQSRDKVEGAGIGLAIVKKIVESNGGQVSIDADYQDGARFVFTWPAPADRPRSSESSGNHPVLAPEVIPARVAQPPRTGLS